MKILIAEDDVVAQEMLKYVLNKLSIEYTIVGDGHIAVTECQKESYDFILLDMYMPVMSGAQAAKLIRQNEKNQNKKSTPLFILSADSPQNIEKEIQGINITGVLQKPITKEKLNTIISTI